jgi:hypothetical protein
MKTYGGLLIGLAVLVLAGCDYGIGPAEAGQDGIGGGASALRSFGDSTDVTAAGANNPSQSRARQVLNFTAPMDSRQEVALTEVVSNATGTATFQYRSGSGEIRYKLIVANIENVRMAHIHVGARGVNGPVVVWLYPDAPPAQLIEGRFSGILAEGVITEDSLVGQLAGKELEDLLELLMSGDTYVNVHTDQYPAGEIRGQIDRGNGVQR